MSPARRLGRPPDQRRTLRITRRPCSTLATLATFDRAALGRPRPSAQQPSQRQTPESAKSMGCIEPWMVWRAHVLDAAATNSCAAFRTRHRGSGATGCSGIGRNQVAAQGEKDARLLEAARDGPKTRASPHAQVVALHDSSPENASVVLPGDEGTKGNQDEYHHDNDHSDKKDSHPDPSLLPAVIAVVCPDAYLSGPQRRPAWTVAI